MLQEGHGLQGSFNHQLLIWAPRVPRAPDARCVRAGCASPKSGSGLLLRNLRGLRFGEHGGRRIQGLNESHAVDHMSYSLNSYLAEFPPLHSSI